MIDAAIQRLDRREGQREPGRDDRGNGELDSGARRQVERIANLLRDGNLPPAGESRRYDDSIVLRMRGM